MPQTPLNNLRISREVFNPGFNPGTGEELAPAGGIERGQWETRMCLLGDSISPALLNSVITLCRRHSNYLFKICGPFLELIRTVESTENNFSCLYSKVCVPESSSDFKASELGILMQREAEAGTQRPVWVADSFPVPKFDLLWAPGDTLASF